MRHAKDPEYGSLLRRLPLGNQMNDFETLNTRFINTNDPLSVMHEELAKVQQENNVLFPVACQENYSRHSINWLRMKALFNAIGRKYSPMFCPAVFNAATKGKRPTKSELEQILSLGDHKLDRLSPLLPVLPGLAAHTTQNRAPKLSLANVSTTTIVGY